MNLVSIDFSISSPAFCCLVDNKYIWGSVTRSDRTSDSLSKNKMKPYGALMENPDFIFKFIQKNDLPENYQERERVKIEYLLDVVNTLWSSILDIMGDREFKVAIEGLSFSSNGNALIDISMATALLRERIINRVGVDNFYVYSPTSIKKFAVKGNAKKDELYRKLSEYSETNYNIQTLIDLLNKYITDWITPANAVAKPMDDIVDATWILLFLSAELKKT